MRKDKIGDISKASDSEAYTCDLCQVFSLNKPREEIDEICKACIKNNEPDEYYIEVKK